MDSPTAPDNESMMMMTIASPIRKYEAPVLHTKSIHDIDVTDRLCDDGDYDDVDFSLSVDEILGFSDTESYEGDSDDDDDGSTSSAPSSEGDNDDGSSFSAGDRNNHRDTTLPSKQRDDVGDGLFLSLEMVKLLRKSASEGNHIGSLLPQCLIDSMTPPAPAATPAAVATTTSSGATSTPRIALSNHSSIVFAIQDRNPTKHSSVDATNKNATHPSPKETMQRILQTKFNIILQCQKYDTVPDDYFVRSIVSSSTYTKQLMTAVRDNDLDTIRHLHETDHCPLQCANQFQESIIHTVARRGYTELLKYLTTVAKVSLRVCCDGGRNALHDACWTSRPNFDVIQLFVDDSPDLLYISDQRNNTPLDYIPKDAYTVWNTWLEAQAHLLKPKVLSFQ